MLGPNSMDMPACYTVKHSWVIRFTQRIEEPAYSVSILRIVEHHHFGAQNVMRIAYCAFHRRILGGDVRCVLRICALVHSQASCVNSHPLQQVGSAPGYAMRSTQYAIRRSGQDGGSLFTVHTRIWPCIDTQYTFSTPGQVRIYAHMCVNTQSLNTLRKPYSPRLPKRYTFSPELFADPSRIVPRCPCPLRGVPSQRVPDIQLL